MTEEITVPANCLVCRKHWEITVPLKQFKLWTEGGLMVQEAFPELSIDDREGLISGTCPKCWSVMFGNEE